MPSTSGALTRGAARPLGSVALLAALTLILSVVAVTAAAPSADADPSWTSVEDATVRPGSELVSESGQCTANFIFTSGDEVLIGSAAHCTAAGAATDVDGCQAGTRQLGAPAAVEGAQFPATLVYSSWNLMQEVGETDPDACLFNDFALLQLDSRDHDRVNPTVPHWGGPVALSDGTAPGERVFSYGNSSLRGGLDLLKPKTGLSLGQMGNGWTHTVYTATPGIPGDSGSAFLDGDGQAMGVVSTVALAPFALSNGVSDLPRALAYANEIGGMDVELALGTEGFSPNQLPVGGLGDLGDGPIDGDLPGSTAGADEDADDTGGEADDTGSEADDAAPASASLEVTLFGRSFGFGL